MDDDDKIQLYMGFFLFAISEIMPFIKKWKGNGICDVIWCAVTNSKCLEGLELEEESEEEEVEVTVAIAA